MGGNESYATGCLMVLAVLTLTVAAGIVAAHWLGAALGLAVTLALIGAFFVVCALVVARAR